MIRWWDVGCCPQPSLVDCCPLWSLHIPMLDVQSCFAGSKRISELSCVKGLFVAEGFKLIDYIISYQPIPFNSIIFACRIIMSHWETVETWGNSCLSTELIHWLDLPPLQLKHRRKPWQGWPQSCWFRPQKMESLRTNWRMPWKHRRQQLVMLSRYHILNPCIAVCSYVWNMYNLLHRKSTCLAWCKNKVALPHGQYIYSIYITYMHVFQYLYLIYLCIYDYFYICTYRQKMSMILAWWCSGWMTWWFFVRLQYHYLSMIHNVQKIGFALWRKEVMADVMSSEFPLLLDFLFDEYWALTTPDANCHTRVHRRASWDSNLRHLTRWTWCGTTGNYQKILWHNPQCHMYSPNLSLFILCLHIYIYLFLYRYLLILICTDVCIINDI